MNEFNNPNQNTNPMQNQNTNPFYEQNIDSINRKLNNNQVNGGGKKKKSHKLIAFLLIVILIAGIVFAVVKLTQNNNADNKATSDDITYDYGDNGSLKFVDGKYSDVKITDEATARQALNDLKDKIKFNDVDKEFKLDYTEKVKDINYYRFNQVYNEIPVYNKSLIVSADKDGNALGFSGYYLPNIDINTNPKFTKEQVDAAMDNYLGESATIISNNLIIYTDDNENKLVYEVMAYSKSREGIFYVDANKGEMIKEEKAYVTAQFNLEGLDGQRHNVNLTEWNDPISNWQKNKYTFTDSERNINIRDYHLFKQGNFFFDESGALLVSMLPGEEHIVVTIENGDIKSSSTTDYMEKASVTCLDTYAKIYDYYYDVLGRKSYDNCGSPIEICLGIEWDNASWVTFTNKMYIGEIEGKSLCECLDVLTHEFTHGVVSRTAKFRTPSDKNTVNYPGALNEAYADVMGCCIERNWDIGEKVTTIRSISDPNAYNDPKSMSDINAYPTGIYTFPDGTQKPYRELLGDKNVQSYDEGGVHTNSTIISHSAYLMYQAGAFKDFDEMANVWYLSLYALTPDSNFEDCANAVMQAGKFYGLSDESIKKIRQAFIETEVLDLGEAKIKGTVTADGKGIEKATVEFKQNNKIVKSINTDSSGYYEFKLPEGDYEVSYSKNGYNTVSKNVSIVDSDVEENVELQKTEVKQSNDSSIIELNKTNDFVYLTIYFLENADAKGISENKQTYKVDKGYALDKDILIKKINEMFGAGFLKYENKSFKIKVVDGFDCDFAWYYKGTNKKFDFDEPINEDTELEMKMFSGLIDDDTMQMIDSIFSKFNN